MRSLYSKFILFTVGIMLASGLVAFLAVNTLYHQYLKPQNDAKNMQIAENIVAQIEANDAIVLDDLFQMIADVGYKLIVVNDARVSQFFGVPFREDNLDQQSIDLVLDGESYHGMRDFPNETFVTGFFADETANTVGFPFTHNGANYGLFLRPNIKMLFTEVHYLLGGMFVVMGLVSLFGMALLARGLIKPIIKLTEATKQVKDANFSVALPTNRQDEIGQLAKSFHAMAKQIEASDHLRKQFISDLTHDLQTPLQNIQGYAALLNETGVSPTDQQTYANVIQTETERLSNLTKQLLLLTTLDSLTNILVEKEVSISEQIKTTLMNYRWLTNEKNITVLAEIDDCTFTGDPAFLEKIWDNLFSNACKYSLEDGVIEVSLQQSAENLIFTIKDDGFGIDSTQIPQLFQRFYRVDSSRHAEIPGTGLGLAIIAQVVALYDGEIQVESALGKGSTFTVTLPITH